MTDKEEKDLLDKLGKFMVDTSNQIKALMLLIRNQQVDIENLKKNLNQNRILVKH
jgi:hypothetical protein